MLTRDKNLPTTFPQPIYLYFSCYVWTLPNLPTASPPRFRLRRRSSSVRDCGRSSSCMEGFLVNTQIPTAYGRLCGRSQIWRLMTRDAPVCRTSQCCRVNLFLRLQSLKRRPKQAQNSAVAEKPRDASCHSRSLKVIIQVSWACVTPNSIVTITTISLSIANSIVDNKWPP